MVGHSRVPPLHLPDLNSYRRYWIHLFTSPLLHERCDNWSIVHLDIGLPIVPTVVITVLSKFHLYIWGEGIISCEFWYTVVSLAANISSCFHHTNVDGKAIQDVQKRKSAAQWALLCQKVLLSMNINDNADKGLLTVYSCLIVASRLLSYIRS